MIERRRDFDGGFCGTIEGIGKACKNASFCDGIYILSFSEFCHDLSMDIEVVIEDFCEMFVSSPERYGGFLCIPVDFLIFVFAPPPVDGGGLYSEMSGDFVDAPSFFYEEYSGFFFSFFSIRCHESQPTFARIIPASIPVPTPMRAPAMVPFLRERVSTVRSLSSIRWM